MRVASNAPQFERHEADDPVAARTLRDPDRFAPHRFTDEDPRTAPFHLPILVDAPDLMRRVIPRLLKLRRIGSGRRHITARWRPKAQRFMRPLVIEFRPHPIEPSLLRPRRRSRRLTCFLLQVR